MKSRQIRHHHRQNESISGLLLLLPALLLIFFFLLLPACMTIILSLSDGKGFNIGSFVGLANYSRLFHDKNFFSWKGFSSEGAIITSLQWLLLGVPVVICLGFCVALLTQQYKHRKLFRGIFFIPLVISGTSTAIIWMFVFTPNPNVGLLAALLHASVSWLGNPKTVNIALVFIWIWSQMGMALIILAAALEHVPTELLEAASIDGANNRQSFWHITLPAIRPQFSFLVVTELVQVLKVFDIVFVLTDGGPANKSQTLALLFYKQTFIFSSPHYGAAVVSIMAFFIVMIYYISRVATREEA
ncbi:MAG: sugar ABC transporter permease [Spirochaetia bacterium]|nr:sugar ABC transporter permease [Spirochaetia bacterium]MCH3918295.1 sugar ABC transporter permease [Spirochaetia bacterium]